MPETDLQYPTCEHIRSDGSFCMSPAMSGKPFCYYHHRDALRRRNLRQAGDLQGSASHRHLSDDQRGVELMRSLGFPDLEDAVSLQVGLSSVARALALGHLDPRRASLLIRVLRAALANLKNLPAIVKSREMVIEDFDPIAPLISPCAPEPWEVGSGSDLGVYPERSDLGSSSERSEESLSRPEISRDCHPERSEGPLPSTEMEPPEKLVASEVLCAVATRL